MSNPSTRRSFLHQATALAGAATTAPYWFTAAAADEKQTAPSDRPVVGFIAVGDRANQLLHEVYPYAQVAAVADVDEGHLHETAERISQQQNGQAPDTYGDYCKLLERKDLDAVVIVTPDHWHTKCAVEALQAGKHVYCEKPLTLTIDEGKRICRAVKETGKTFQVGTQQRTEMGRRFLQAVALVREGRIGEPQQAWVAINGAPRGGPFPAETPPARLDWEMWQGQTPEVDYREKRVHYEFRWWYEYSGGKMTDWGAHHMDIAQWAMGLDDTSATHVEPLVIEHPVPFQDGYPVFDNQYNTATRFQLRCQFKDGKEIRLHDSVDEEIATFPNGILLVGSKGKIFVSRDKLSGKAVEEMKDNPLSEDALTKVYKGRQPSDKHMGDFFQCIKTGDEPISDVFSHHRMLTTCHLANIALRLARPIEWDPVAEQMVGNDEEAAAMVSRPQRTGYEIPS